MLTLTIAVWSFMACWSHFELTHFGKGCSTPCVDAFHSDDKCAPKLLGHIIGLIKIHKVCWLEFQSLWTWRRRASGCFFHISPAPPRPPVTLTGPTGTCPSDPDGQSQFPTNAPPGSHVIVVMALACCQYIYYVFQSINLHWWSISHPVTQETGRNNSAKSCVIII